MRLLNTTTKQLSQYFDDERPAYAILSHTWGPDEVTLQNLQTFLEKQSSASSQSITSTAGWKKIEACCNQALLDGLEWAWIDTCCIDKTNSVELSEAINSMFAWYKESEVCYAFLSDVDERLGDISATTSSFRKSRWFRRGWTLQELIAPGRVLFFNSTWNTLGELVRDSTLSSVVSAITSIPPVFLEGTDPSEANIAIRMSWASARETTRKEDMAYSLLGIFDINMPLMYGEGQKAFGRLQEELVKRTSDHSLLAWGLLPWDDSHSSDERTFSVFAASARDFANSGNLCLCPRNVANGTTRAFQMTSDGLRVQLSLVAPRTKQTRRKMKFLAVLDCFSRNNPTFRIAIQLQKVSRECGISDHFTVYEGDTFQRIGRKLLVSGIPPNGFQGGYKYPLKNIIIADRKADTLRGLGGSLQPGVLLRSQHILLDFPGHYRCDVKYIHPWYRLRKNPYTVELLSFIFSRSIYHTHGSNEEAFDKSPTVASPGFDALHRFRCTICNCKGECIKEMEAHASKDRRLLACFQLTGARAPT